MFNKVNIKLKKDNEQLKIKVGNLDQALNQRQQVINTLKEESNRLKSSVEKLEKERDKLKSLIRDQTDADLLINSLKAIGIIKEETKGSDYKIEHDRLMALRQEAGLRAMQGPIANAYSQLGGLGGFI